MTLKNTIKRIPKRNKTVPKIAKVNTSWKKRKSL